MPQPPTQRRTCKVRVSEFFAKPPSTGLTIAIGVSATLIAGGLATGLSFLVQPLTTATSNLPNSALIAGGIGVATGLLLAWIGTVVYYRLRNYTTRLELNDARKELGKLDRAKETLGRIELYADHIYSLLETFVRDAQALHDLSARDTERAICDMPQKYLSDATGLPFLLSIWVEPVPSPQGLFGRAADRMRGTLQDWPAPRAGVDG